MLSAEATQVLGIKTPPMGLAYLAAALEAEGYQPKIIDANALELNFIEMRKKLEKESPDVVCVTSITPMIYEAMASVKVAKSVSPNSTTILGGPHATFCPMETLENCPELDVVCLGEGEETLTELIQKVEKEQNLDDVKGIIYRKSGHFYRTEPRPLIKDLDNLPFPARHLLPMNHYTVLGRNYPSINIVSSRGCPFRCSFCSSSYFYGKSYRARTAKNVVDEIEQVVNKYKVKSIEFSDDTFTLYRSRVEEICEEIIRRKLDISWVCSSRANLVTRDLLIRMKKAGCHIVLYGIESGSPRILKLMKKGETPIQMARAVKVTKETGMETLGSFILGYPEETRSELLQTIHFSKKIGIDFAEFSIATPYPGTELFEFSVKKELLLTKDWSLYTGVKPVINPKYYSVEELNHLFVKAYRSFYASPGLLIHHLGKGRIGFFAKVIKNLIPKFFRMGERRSKLKPRKTFDFCGE
ncbi:MAG: B12-binding domain-containing radical SAM protein [Candidatus Bathyarchaeota archaeon]|nr:B12-binding domain-containing radical SAM protein [Candidatus Bathyarchaeota archaeon]